MVPSDKNNPESALRPSKSWNEVVKNYQFLENLNVGYAQIKDVIDSSDMNHEIWKEIAEIIDENYYKYKGFVILHGTDTMAYTANMLSFIRPRNAELSIKASTASCNMRFSLR